MPPPKIPIPEFSPIGRYLMDTSKRIESFEAGEIPIFHDTQNYQEQCPIGDRTTNHVRFNNKEWALARGFGYCSFCF